MTRKPTEAGISYAVLTDGLRTYDLIEYQTQRAPNYSEHERFRQWHDAEFCKMIDEQDRKIESLLKEISTGPLDITGLTKLYTTAEPLSVEYFAAKYMLHRRLIDRFQEQGHTLAAEREIYLLGQTWAEGQFTEHRDHARRGRDVGAGSNLGAEMRRNSLAPQTEQILKEMRRLIEEGRGVTDAAEAVARRGIGKNGPANRAAWYRHSRKKV